MTSPRFLDIHVLQTVPPSNINRDDAGSPKQAIYGGVRRARVSSQAWKRAARVYTAERQPVEARSTRTKRLVELVAPLVAERAGISAADAARITTAVVRGTVTMDGKKAGETSYLLFFGREQVGRVADLVAQHAAELVALDDDAKALDKAGAAISLLPVLGTGHPLDVALYGRMVADMASLNVDASVQVAHALSTHAVELEFDYYTAVDDENAADETGAGMIGTVEFNSATLYRYATVAVDQLAANLGDGSAVDTAVTEFVDAFVKSMPTGHQNSFANRTRPTLVLVVGRDDQPVNLVTAFEEPVTPDGGGIEGRSLARLAKHFCDDVAQWGDHPVLVAANYTAPTAVAGDVAAAFGQSVSFDALLECVSDAIGVVAQ